MQPKIILVDKNDKVIGYSGLESGHQGSGKKHRAFVTLLFNDKGQVLLQKRKHRLFDGLWDFTAISHPLRINGKTESYQEASDRALKKEMGVKHVDVKKVGAFNYFAKDGKNCENEYCAVLVGKFDGKFQPNSKEVYEATRVKYRQFIEDIAKKPSKYTLWAQKAAKVIQSIKSSLF